MFCDNTIIILFFGETVKNYTKDAKSGWMVKVQLLREENAFTITLVFIEFTFIYTCL